MYVSLLACLGLGRWSHAPSSHKTQRRTKWKSRIYILYRARYRLYTFINFMHTMFVGTRRWAHGAGSSTQQTHIIFIANVHWTVCCFYAPHAMESARFIRGNEWMPREYQVHFLFRISFKESGTKKHLSAAASPEYNHHHRVAAARQEKRTFSLCW